MAESSRQSDSTSPADRAYAVVERVAQGILERGECRDMPTAIDRACRTRPDLYDLCRRSTSVGTATRIKS
jgi:hypothetical protein